MHAWMFLQNSTKRKLSFMPGIFASIFLIFPPACSLASCSWFCHSLACANALQSMFLKNLEKKKKGFFPHFAVRVRGYRGIFAAQIIVLLLVNSWPHSFINTDEKAQLEKKKQHHCWRKKKKKDLLTESPPFHNTLECINMQSVLESCWKQTFNFHKGKRGEPWTSRSSDNNSI